jgi:hypothetical protein
MNKEIQESFVKRLENVGLSKDQLSVILDIIEFQRNYMHGQLMEAIDFKINEEFNYYGFSLKKISRKRRKELSVKYKTSASKKGK